jgi:hypothetical protein
MKPKASNGNRRFGKRGGSATEGAVSDGMGAVHRECPPMLSDWAEGRGATRW